MTPTFDVRRRVEIFAGTDEWVPVTVRRAIPPARAALIICDLWDDHWSRGAAERAAKLAPRIDTVAKRLRERGALIVHAPSDTMDFYADHPARVRTRDVPRVEPPAPLKLPDPPLPIDDSDGGSDTGETEWYRAWTRQSPDVEIADDDVISDDGGEIYSVLRSFGIHRVLMLGVHTNMCILNRSFGIKNLVRWRMPTVLVRDLTDAMYNPAMPPYVSHDHGTELVVEHIEKHWCPTTTSADLLA